MAGRASTTEQVSQLLQKGLEFYGAGDVARAFLTWSEVLELDPGNAEALDYMRDADRRSRPRSQDGPARSLLDDARRLLHADDAEAALELLSSAPGHRSLEVEAMVELLRAHLYGRYRAELGDLSVVPRLKAGSASALQGRNLPPTAGFLLSMVDGMTPLSDLISVSGMDRFEALRSVFRMHGAGILELSA
jgi:hypothetical protein